MHDVGDALLGSCFADPVMDQERLTLYYPTPVELIKELRGVGVGNTHLERAAGLTGRKKWKGFLAGLESQRSEQGIPLTYEVVYGLAWGTGVSPV
jgi:malonyl-CoA O-methyltransferase